MSNTSTGGGTGTPGGGSAEAPAENIAAECVDALRGTPASLPTKYLYDARGSRLFERITDQPEYTLTRDELAIFDEHIDEIARAIGPDAWVIELGSGDGRKTRLLLESLESPAGYTPIEISEDALDESVLALREAMPDLDVVPLHADFTDDLDFEHADGRTRVVFLPGSTIGNFAPDAARDLMRRFADWVGPGGGLLIGVDLVKPEAELVPAYSDAGGVTAAFNLNLLDRLNREADADFDLERWTHRASWNPDRERMESRLVSTADQVVTLGGETFTFREGDAILTEYSHKYTPGSLAALASRFDLRQRWQDPEGRFMVAYCVCKAPKSEERA